MWVGGVEWGWAHCLIMPIFYCTVIFFVVLIIFAMLTKYYKLSIFTFLEIVDIYYCGSLF